MQVEAARVTSVGNSRADVEFQTCLLLIPVQGCWALWGALTSSAPRDLCSQSKSHGCHWTVQMLQLSRAGLRYSASWEMLHSCSKSQGCAGDCGVLGLGVLALAPSSLPAQCTGGMFQENLKPQYPFRRLLSFLFQAGWIAVSELSLIIRVEQWSLLLTASFSEPCCAGFIIISQG